jgi:copper transport protein
VTDPWPLLYEAGPKAALYALAQFAVGVAVAHWLLRRAPNDPGLESLIPRLDERLARLAVWIPCLAMAALAARVWGHTAVSFGAADAWSPENLGLIAWESRWGQAWRVQLVAACALLAAAIVINLRPRFGWIAFTVAAFALCWTVPLLGHGAGSIRRLLVHGTHLMASAAWVGTLAAIAALCVRAQGRDTTIVVAALVRRFSAMALPGAAMVVLTGLIAAVTYVGSWANLFGTPYGRALVVKLAGFSGVVLCGWVNWQRSRRGDVPRVQIMMAELAFAAAVIATTSVLTELEHP